METLTTNFNQHNCVWVPLSLKYYNPYNQPTGPEKQLYSLIGPLTFMHFLIDMIENIHLRQFYCVFISCYFIPFYFILHPWLDSDAFAMRLYEDMVFNLELSQEGCVQFLSLCYRNFLIRVYR